MIFLGNPFSKTYLPNSLAGFLQKYHHAKY